MALILTHYNHVTLTKRVAAFNIRQPKPSSTAARRIPGTAFPLPADQRTGMKDAGPEKPACNLARPAHISPDPAVSRSPHIKSGPHQFPRPNTIVARMPTAARKARLKATPSAVALLGCLRWTKPTIARLRRPLPPQIMTARRVQMWFTLMAGRPGCGPRRLCARRPPPPKQNRPRFSPPSGPSPSRPAPSFDSDGIGAIPPLDPPPPGPRPPRPILPTATQTRQPAQPRQPHPSIR